MWIVSHKRLGSILLKDAEFAGRLQYSEQQLLLTVVTLILTWSRDLLILISWRGPALSCSLTPSATNWVSLLGTDTVNLFVGELTNDDVTRWVDEYFLWSPYGIGKAIIFSCCGFYFLSIFFPRLISACGPSANLECRSETCCARLW